MTIEYVIYPIIIGTSLGMVVYTLYLNIKQRWPQMLEEAKNNPAACETDPRIYDWIDDHSLNDPRGYLWQKTFGHKFDPD